MKNFIALGCQEVLKKFECGWVVVVLNQLPCNPNQGQVGLGQVRLGCVVTISKNHKNYSNIHQLYKVQSIFPMRTVDFLWGIPVLPLGRRCPAIMQAIITITTMCQHRYFAAWFGFPSPFFVCFLLLRDTFLYIRPCVQGRPRPQACLRPRLGQA